MPKVGRAAKRQRRRSDGPLAPSRSIWRVMDLQEIEAQMNEWADEFSDDADTQEAFVDGCLKALGVILAAEIEVKLCD